MMRGSDLTLGHSGGLLEEVSPKLRAQEREECSGLRGQHVQRPGGERERGSGGMWPGRAGWVRESQGRSSVLVHGSTVSCPVHQGPGRTISAELGTLLLDSPEDKFWKGKGMQVSGSPSGVRPSSLSRMGSSSPSGAGSGLPSGVGSSSCPGWRPVCRLERGLVRVRSGVWFAIWGGVCFMSRARSSLCP